MKKIIIGPPGCGKTYRTRKEAEKYKGNVVYLAPDSADFSNRVNNEYVKELPSFKFIPNDKPFVLEGKLFIYSTDVQNGLLYDTAVTTFTQDEKKRLLVYDDGAWVYQCAKPLAIDILSKSNIDCIICLQEFNDLYGRVPSDAEIKEILKVWEIHYYDIKSNTWKQHK